MSESKYSKKDLENSCIDELMSIITNNTISAQDRIKAIDVAQKIFSNNASENNTEKTKALLASMSNEALEEIDSIISSPEAM